MTPHPRCIARGTAPVAVVILLSALVSSGARADDADCLACHGIGEDAVDLPPEQQVDPARWQASVHADMGFGCTDCHSDKSDYPHEKGAAPALCADCHDDVASVMLTSVHGQDCCAGDSTKTSPFPKNETCGACHGIHDVLAVDDEQSPVYYRNIPSTCAQCHGDLKVMKAQGIDVDVPDLYLKSIHGRELKDSKVRPAVCTDCHGGGHAILRANESSSSTNPFKIPATCGQCHSEEDAQYTDSVHGHAFLQHGITAAPVCTTCHGIHSIGLAAPSGATETEKRLARTTCPACHGSEALVGEYGISATRVRSYRASYHGLANERGNTAVADCASCHGIHAIYASTDPRSSVAPQNLQQTCGKCHPGASEQFARNPVHYNAAEAAPGPEVVITQWVKRIYWALILLVLGGMIVHNLVIMSFYVRRKLRAERARPGRLRFTRNQVLQHGALVISFAVLALTGFMLAYPETWWSRALVDVGVTESIRRWVHRGAAVVLVGTAFVHLWWAIRHPYGRAEIRRILPGLRDLRELTQNMRYHLGRSDLPAAFAKYDYPAKAEYWALVWGTIVMALTGLVLWFPVVATSFLPFWVVKVSQVIHLFEAWLATLAILIFHFFYVMGHPDVYPISLAMLHGRMSEEDAAHHHPTWTDDGRPRAVDVAGDGPGEDQPRSDESAETLDISS